MLSPTTSSSAAARPARERKSPNKYEPPAEARVHRGGGKIKKYHAVHPKRPAFPLSRAHARGQPENKFYVYEVPGRNGKRKKYQALNPKTGKKMGTWYYQAAAQAEVARVCTPKEYLAIAAQCECCLLYTSPSPRDS